MSELTYIFGRISTTSAINSGVNLSGEFGQIRPFSGGSTFQIIISVTKYQLFYTKAVIIYIQQFASKHKPQTFSRVCLRLKRGVYRWKRNVSLLMWRVIVQSLIQLFFMFWCAFVYFSMFPSSRYCKSDQTCLYSYFLWLERIIMGLEILKRARRHIKTWQLRQK
jgi:hypothetical protein